MKLAVPRTPFFGRDVKDIPGEVRLLVPPDEIFRGTAHDEETLLGVLATLSRDDTLIHCARLNTLVSGPGGYDFKGRQQRALQVLCTNEQIDRINAFARKFPRAEAPTIFFRGQVLELMRWTARHCRNLPNDGTTFTSAETRSQFVKAALIAGMLRSQSVYGNRLSGVQRDNFSGADNIVAVRRRALGAFRKGVEEGNLAPHFGVTLGRGWSLFKDYLPGRYPDFAQDFLRATGLSLEEYLTCTTGLATYTIFDKAEGPLFVTHTVVAATPYRDILPKYLDLESQTADRLATTLWGTDFERDGYRSIRERPIFVTQDGRGIILDPTLYLERISVGPLFYALAGKNRRKANEVFGAFGLAFEDYATDVLRRMYPERPGLFKRAAFNVLGEDMSGRGFEIDAALNDVVEAVVFEMKAGWIREETVLDDQRFLDEVRAKYGALPRTGEREKGVAQLARSVGAIARREWLGPNDEYRDVKVLYPVLVVHDVRMGGPAMGNFLSDEFTKLLGSAPAHPRIAPLTVMTVDDLENMESSSANFSMCSLLRDYTRECPDRLRSLHNFIVYSAYGSKILPSSELIRGATELIDEVRRRFFPTDAQ